MTIGLATMGKFNGPPIEHAIGGSGRTYYEDKKKPTIRISSVRYKDNENINVIVTSIEEE